MYTKISDSKYRIEIAGELTDIAVPQFKVETLFTEFIGKGGIINERGEVQTDIGTMILSFRTVGDILLTKFGPKGSVIEDGDCSLLSSSEVAELFEIATEVMTNFLETVKAITERQQARTVEKSEKEKALKTAKKAKE